MKRTVLFFILCLFVIQKTVGQTDKKVIIDTLINENSTPFKPLETDRPDQTEASSVIPYGSVQVETGFLWQKTKKATYEVDEFLYPSMLVRVGILPRMEVRAIGEFAGQKVKSPERTKKMTKGLNAFAVGTKIYICEEKGLQPEISFIGHLTLPSGSRNFRPAYTAPQFRFSLSHTLTENLSLGYNLGYEWDGEIPRGAAIYTLTLGTALSDKIGAYLEIFGEKPENLPFLHNLDGGLTLLLLPNLQLDASAGFGLTSNSFDQYLSTGLSWRFLK